MRREPESVSSTGHLVHNYLLKQRYRIIGTVGRGGFGAVYKARDSEHANQIIAVKEMSKSGLTPQEILEATDTFQREALMLAQLSHPRLPRFYDYFADGERCYVVLEFIDGETLEEHLLKVTGGRLPLDQVLPIGLQLCEVLHYLHTRQPPVIFRDLKPSNVMLTPDDSVYLIDFGVARQFKPSQTRDTIPFGSPGYAAPEQYGRAQTTPLSDIYSLGVTLYQLLTGVDPTQTPFHFAPFQLPNQPTPTELQALIGQMLELDASKRPASVVVVQQALDSVAAQQAQAQASITQPGTPYTSQPAAGAHSSPHVSSPTLTPTRLTSPAQALPSPKRGFIFSTYRRHPAEVYTLAWSPDGTHIASAGEDQTVHVWEALAGQHIFTYFNHFSTVFSVAWSPDGERIASAGKDCLVHIWEAPRGQGILRNALHWLHSLELVTGIKDFTYRLHTGAVRAVAWSPDGDYIASGDDHHTIQVWKALTGMHIITYAGHTDEVRALSWNPNRGAGTLTGGQVMPRSKRIASASNDHTLRVWQVDTGKKIFLARNRSYVVHAVAWSPDGKYIASGSSDTTVRVWEVSSGHNVFIYRGHTGSVHAVAWSPDGKYIASGSSDTTVQIWQARSGQDVFTHHGHSNTVHAVAWSPDGQRIASAGSDTTVQVWLAV